MRHRVKAKTLQRNTKQRKALLRELLRSLFEHGEIVTTQAKAKEVKRLSDKMIARAKKNTIASKRLLHRDFGKRDVVNVLVDKIAPVFKDRNSGFTTIQKVGKRRGDNTLLVRLSLIKKPENMGTLKSGRQVKSETGKKAAKKESK